MKDHKDVRIHTKVDATTFRILEERRRAGGFRSIYKLVQTLLVGFCRYSDRDYDRRFADGMRQEIDEMFDELMNGMRKEKHMTTDRRNGR